MSDPDRPKIGNINVTLGNNNKVGDIGHKFYGPPARHLTQEDKTVFLERVPKGRRILLIYQASESDAEGLANEWSAFLLASGYSVDGPNPGMILSPARGVSVNLNEDRPEQAITITIGAR